MTLPVRLKPLFAPVVSRLVGSGHPEVEVIQPAETEPVRPPALLPGMLDRVTGTDEHSRLAYHLGNVAATTTSHVPVLRKTFRNALVRRLGFATWRHGERYAPGLGGLSGPLVTVPELRYCHSYVIWRYFGHWLSEGMPSTLIDPDLGPVWMPPHPTWAHAQDYIRALEVPVLAEPLAHAERLIVYQDFGQGSHKQARYARMRDKLQARFGTGAATDCVYVRRGRTGAPRWIANEATLIDALVARGWQVADIATEPVESLLRKLCRARVVVSVEGSHINHAQVSLRPGGTIVLLMPNDRFTSQHVGLARAHRLSPGIVVMPGNRDAGYTVDPDEVFRTIDLADAAPRA